MSKIIPQINEFYICRPAPHPLSPGPCSRPLGMMKLMSLPRFQLDQVLRPPQSAYAANNRLITQNSTMISFASYAASFQSALIAHGICKSVHPVATAGSEGLTTLTCLTLANVECVRDGHKAGLHQALGKNHIFQNPHDSIASI